MTSRKCDRIIFTDNDFVCFGDGDYGGGHGGGQYSIDSQERAAAVRAFNLLRERGGTIEYHEHGYWMKGPLGSEYVSNPIELAKKLGFL